MCPAICEPEHTGSDSGSQKIEALVLENQRLKVKGKNNWYQSHLARFTDIT